MKEINDTIRKLCNCHTCEMYKNCFCKATPQDCCSHYTKLQQFAEFVLNNADFQKKNTMKNK